MPKLHKDIRLGWEVECYYNDDIISKSAFIRKIKAVCSKITHCDDCSLDYCGIEFQTPPQSVRASLKTLKKIFDIIKEYGYTDDGCGLHLNMSTKSGTKYKNFNPLLFCENPLIEDIGEYFDRQTNEYCYNYMPEKKTRLDRLQTVADDYFGKDSAINLESWRCFDKRYRRLEVRIMGNEHYHKKYPKISSYTSRLIKLFNYCCRPNFIKV